jgi:uroporphyrinogen-III synthase
MKPIYLFSLTKHDGVTHINSLHVEYFTPEIDFKKYDYLIITSKQVFQALQSYGDLWKSKEVLTVGEPTAQALKSAGGRLLEYGFGYGEDLTKIIKSYPKETQWLYLRAKEVASDFAAICQDEGYSLDEVVLYETTCSAELLHIKVEDDATLIFTSPSSVRCFLQHHDLQPTHNIIVIGTTTAKAIPLYIKYKIADKPTLQSCIQKAKE